MTRQLFAQLLVALALGAAGQVSMKYGMGRYTSAHGEIKGLAMLLAAMTQWGVICGLGCFVLSSMLYLVLMSKMPLSVLYPMVALNYVFVTILSRIFFQDHPNALRIAGLAVIIGGVSMVAMSQPAPRAPQPVETPSLEAAP